MGLEEQLASNKGRALRNRADAELENYTGPTLALSAR
jgi:hypothetical protein